MAAERGLRALRSALTAVGQCLDFENHSASSTVAQWIALYTKFLDRDNDMYVPSVCFWLPANAFSSIESLRSFRLTE
jgi:hypothetical protein